MKTPSIHRPSPAMIVALLALFAALGGGAYAASVPRNSVGAKQIRPSAVGASEIRKNAVRASELRAGSVGASEIRRGAVTGADIAPGGIGGGQIAPGAVGSTAVADRSLGIGELSFPLGGLGTSDSGGEKLPEGAPLDFVDLSRLPRTNFDRFSSILLNGTVEVTNPGDVGTAGQAGKVILRVLVDGQVVAGTSREFSTTVADGATQSAPLTTSVGGPAAAIGPTIPAGIHDFTLQAAVDGARVNIEDTGFNAAVLP